MVSGVRLINFNTKLGKLVSLIINEFVSRRLRSVSTGGDMEFGSLYALLSFDKRWLVGVGIGKRLTIIIDDVATIPVIELKL